MSSSIVINKRVLSGLNGMFNDMILEVMNKCSDKYGFSVEEAMREVCLPALSDKAVSKSKPNKEKVVREVRAKAAFPLPFSYNLDETLCQAVVQNGGLYTQCESNASTGCYCKKHSSQAEKSSAGIPEHGTMSQRMEAGLMDYVSPSGKSPMPYVKMMKKLKVSEEQVREEVSRLNMKFDERHFEGEEMKKGRPAKAEKVPKEAKQSKGRPKKVKPTVELAEVTDLFQSMVLQSVKEASESEGEPESESESENESMALADKESKVANKGFKKADKEAEKAAKKAALEAEKAAKKLAEEEEKATKKAAMEAEKVAKKAAEEAEKAAKKAAEEAEKVAKKAAEEEKKAAKKLAEDEKAAKKAAEEEKKAAKKLAEDEKAAKKAAEEQEKAAKKAAMEAEKIAKKAAEEAKKEPKKKATKKAAEPVPEPEPVVEPAAEEEEEEDVVVPMSFEGVNYLKSTTTGIIYNMEQDEVGQWNAKTNKIDFYEDSDEEEEADEELEPEVCEE